MIDQRRIRTSLIAFAVAAGLGTTLRAAAVNVATWTTSSGNTGGGTLTATGSLNGNSLTLLTAAVPPNSGLTFFEDWTATPATNGYVTSQVPTSGNTGVAIGEGASSTETITFLGAAVTNPVLLIDFADPTVTYVFGSLSTTLLSSHNASLSGSNILSFPGATDTDGDGAAVQINGTLSSITFTATDSGGRTDTQRFTIATPAVPEPASLILGGLATLLIALGCVWRRWCKQPVASWI